MTSIHDSLSAEIGVEIESQGIDDINQVVERCHQGLSINNSRLAERYTQM